MKNSIICYLFFLLLFGCSQPIQHEKSIMPQDDSFNAFTVRFIDDLWKVFPEWASSLGNHKYDTSLVVPDDGNRLRVNRFCTQYLDSLKNFKTDSLSPNYRADYWVVEDELNHFLWSNNVFKEYKWNPASYNIGEGFDKLLKAKHAYGADKMRLIFHKMKNIQDYYLAAQSNIVIPTVEHTRLAIDQMRGVIDIFDKTIRDSMNKSIMGEHERQMIEVRLNQSLQAIRDYVSWLEKSLLPSLSIEKAKNFRIGKDLFFQKFDYDVCTSSNAEISYKQALVNKKIVREEMIKLSEPMWGKYFPAPPLPDDKIKMVKKIIDTLSVSHVERNSLLRSIHRQIPELISFVNHKELIFIDTTRTLVVRETPVYKRGVAGASIDAPGFYEKEDTTYYNVTPLDNYSPAEAESYLREYNFYTMQVLNIHEAVPGHYVQLIYSNNSTGMIGKIFSNGALVEGWAVYAERMMMEEGYGDNPKGSGVMDTAMWLLYDKWHLRVICNTILDYGIHVSGMSENDAINLLVNEAFQQDTEAKEKWKRATLSQVQLCTYYSGYLEIYALREELKEKLGSRFNLKEFHEKFLSYGSIPTRFIRQLMLEE